MTMITIRELAEELGVSKSLLHYYYKMGLIEAENVIGKMLILNKAETKRRIAKVKRYKREGYKLEEIAKELKK